MFHRLLVGLLLVSSICCSLWLAPAAAQRATAPSAPAYAPTALPLPAETLRASAPEAILISNAERKTLGIMNGPDSMAELWHSGDGVSYLVFSGARTDHVRGTFRVRVDRALTRAIAPSAGLVEVLMRPGNEDPVPNVPAKGRGYEAFDRDYAGGGGVLQCPGAEGKTLYFYHGENHTDPQGKFHAGPKSGWTGLGMAYWDGAARRFRKDSQIVGVGVSNQWRNEGGTPITSQGPPISGNPSAILQSDGYIYLYYTDLTDDPDSSGRGMQCDRRACVAAVRARAAEVCANAGTGKTSDWRKYHRGGFAEPALFVTDTGGRPAGTGGRFTPLFPRHENAGENVPSVTYLPARRSYVMVMVRQPGGSMNARYSRDGLAWSEPNQVAAPEKPGFVQLYPRLHVVAGQAGAESYVLTYTRRGQDRWTFGELVRQPLSFAKR